MVEKTYKENFFPCIQPVAASANAPSHSNAGNQGDTDTEEEVEGIIELNQNCSENNV